MKQELDQQLKSQFSQRLQGIRSRNDIRKRAGGKVTYKIREDGLVVPVTVSTGKSRFPIGMLVTLVLFLVAAKVGVHFHFGSDTVTSYTADLAENSAGLKVVDVMLQNEPVTDWLVNQTSDMMVTLRQR